MDESQHQRGTTTPPVEVGEVVPKYSSENTRIPAIRLEATNRDDSYDADSAHADASSSDHVLLRTWHDEMPRWLATLDSQRTRREYEKAVSYFFATSGVPATLTDLTFDLLLAYRGSLALRADRQQGTSRQFHTAVSRTRNAIMPHAATALIAGAHPPQDDSDDRDRGSGVRPLAPATVNVRLTALRQFLAHCALWQLTPQLPSDRMRAALRRLSIERRRPYQVLAEPEWAAFLSAARAPSQRARLRLASRSVADAQVPTKSDAKPADGQAAVNPAESTPAGAPVWGITRAMRLRSVPRERVSTSKHDGVQDDGTEEEERPRAAPTRSPDTVHPNLPPLIRSRAGLTGEHTALRDHALLVLALATGLRAVELCALDLGDITREWNAGKEEWWLVLPDAKTKGQRGGRTLPLAEQLMQVLFDYVASTGRNWTRPADRTSPLFLSMRRRLVVSDGSARNSASVQGRLSTNQVRRIVDRVEAQWSAEQSGTTEGEAISEAGDRRAISPHALRHSTAVALLEGNESSGRLPASVEHVRGWLGHFDIRTTQGYLAHLEARRHRRPFVMVPDIGDAINHQPAKDTPKESTDADIADEEPRITQRAPDQHVTSSLPNTPQPPDDAS